MIDCHTHCNHSCDSKALPEEMIKGAIDKGIVYLALTDHFNKDCKYILDGYEQLNLYDMDIVAHVNELKELKEKYSSRINVAIGIELSYSKETEQEYISDLAKTDGWDIVLNSVHTVDGHDIYYKRYFDEFGSKRAAFGRYLERILDSVRAPFEYDVIAHIGYVARKATYPDKVLYYSEFSDIFDEILKGIIARDASIELNGKGEPLAFLPHTGITDRYIELGGRNFTFGSDSHAPEYLGRNYRAVKEYLLSRGIKYLNTYVERRAVPYKLD